MTSVAMFNKVRDETREKLIQDAFKVMNDLLGESSVDITSKDYGDLKNMMTSLQTNLTAKDAQLKENLNKVIKITSTEMTDFVNLLSDATRDSLKTAVSQQPVTRTAGRGGGMTGGNQAFFDLNDS